MLFILSNLHQCIVSLSNQWCFKGILKLLGLLTKKFINLIKQARDGILDLNKAAETLQVKVITTLSFDFLFGGD